MENLREDFLKTYANIPLSLRDDVILVLDGFGPISWQAAFFEVKNNTEASKKILAELKELNLI
jgi:hypothetical protein